MREGSGPIPSPSVSESGLRRCNFRPLSVGGWGDGYNAYAHSMAWYRGRLYVGVARANLHLGALRETAYPWPFYPVKCPGDLLELDARARIWCWNPADDSWRELYCSPWVEGLGGRRIPAEIGIRGMTVFQGPGDDEPVLYASSYAGFSRFRDESRGQGPKVFRCQDGETFHPVSAAGLGRQGLSAFRTLVSFKGRLYTSPVGTARLVPNVSPYPAVMEAVDPARGRWRPVSEPGFGNPRNVAVFEMAEFNGHLYAGTGNVVSGFELWKTRAEGEPPYRWEQVLRLGAYRGNLSEGAVSMCVFGDSLYVGTAIQDGGYDREYHVGPSPGEVIRVYPDDSWDLVCGTARLTPKGVKVPVSGLRPGFNNFFNGYIWRMCVHDGWLYVGTFDWSAYMRFFDVDRWPEAIRDFILKLGIEEAISIEGGCDLLRSRDGRRWMRVTRTGFENPWNTGIRSLVSTPHGLAVGTVNPFGPEVAVKRNGHWSYERNSRGGLEVWLGSERFATRLEGKAAEDQEDEEITGYEIRKVEKDARAPVKRRTARRPAAEFELDEEELRRLGRLIEVQTVRADMIANAYKLHHLKTEGSEHLPREGGFLITCNHVGAPVYDGMFLTEEDALIFGHVLHKELGRPARFMADLGFWDTDLAARMFKESCQKLGFVPVTVGNGRRLLEMDEVVVIYPEGRFSSPDYRLRPFFWGFAKMAWQAAKPVVPAVFIGPHESRQRVEIQGRLVFLNAYAPLPADYKYIFLPPMDVREHVADLSDKDGLKAFSELVRRRMQEALDREGERRESLAQVRALQEKYGD